MYLVGGDFNAQLSSLDTNGVTDNRWRWLGSLIDKTEAVDTFRAKHPGARAYTRYRSAFLNCDTRIDFILCSIQLRQRRCSGCFRPAYMIMIKPQTTTPFHASYGRQTHLPTPLPLHDTHTSGG